MKYPNTRQPCGVHEVNNGPKGNKRWEPVCDERLNYIGKRHVSRLMSDAYGKGIVRSQVESTNLRANTKENAATHAESFRTSQTEAFYGREYLELAERMNGKRKDGQKAVAIEVDGRNARRRKVCIRDMALFYGQRPKYDTLHSSSAANAQISPLCYISHRRSS